MSSGYVCIGSCGLRFPRDVGSESTLPDLNGAVLRTFLQHSLGKFDRLVEALGFDILGGPDTLLTIQKIAAVYRHPVTLWRRRHPGAMLRLVSMREI